MTWFFKYPRLFRWGFNLWFPFWASGIKLEVLSADFRFARVKLKWRPWTRNLNGSQYGGSLFSMTDPIYTTLLLGNLGAKKYYVWDKSATIDFVKVARGAVWFEARLSEEWLAEIIQATANGEKYFPKIDGYLYDKEGNMIAHIQRELYVRLRPQYRPENVSADI